MKLYIMKDYDSTSELAAQMVLEQLRQKPDSVLGLPTGSTPLGMYRNLVRAFQEGRADFSKVTTFNLDEYYGLPQDHPQSYHTYMRQNLFAHINVPGERIHLPDGEATDLETQCRSYDAAITWAGGIDLQILGTGVNGHIGFNEPAAVLQKDTHVTALTRQTIRSNSVLFENPAQMPASAITMGIGAILLAKKILLLANGKNKAKVIRLLYQGKITTQAPLTLLALHSDVTVVLDEAAACFLD